MNAENKYVDELLKKAVSNMTCDIDEEIVKDICKQFNVSYVKQRIFTEYKNNDSVKNVIDCIQKIADLNDEYIEQFNKVVEEISKLQDLEGAAPIGTLKEIMQEEYEVSEEKLTSILKQLKSKGIIYEPTSGSYKKVD